MITRKIFVSQEEVPEEGGEETPKEGEETDESEETE